MANYYVAMSMYEPDERETFYFKTQLPDRKFSTGWGKINPINKSQIEIKKIIEEVYPDTVGTNNPDNGAHSLTLFSYLAPGDIIFVRGVAKIIDIIVITGKAFFDKVGHYGDDYLLKVPFTPLFDKPTSIDTAQIPPEIYNEILFTDGRALVVRELPNDIARYLIKAIVENID